MTENMKFSREPTVDASVTCTVLQYTALGSHGQDPGSQATTCHVPVRRTGPSWGRQATKPKKQMSE